MIKQIQNELKKVKKDIWACNGIIRNTKTMMSDQDEFEIRLREFLLKIDINSASDEVKEAVIEFENKLVEFEKNKIEWKSSITEYSSLLKKSLAREKQLETMIRNPFDLEFKDLNKAKLLRKLKPICKT
ncbi:hypothetical protein D5R38_18705 [Serratia marcescens]|uniref:hypothetical protein n=1 Tax=Serratia marcescens TaxID=615 RepID=UPI001067C2CB|nr:hypothetical protein [Serratia marcescens]TEW83402.1 hypothetical protein D5R38_18705 [Serratia marcescens]